MALPTLTPRAHQAAATLRLAASSVAHVPCGYARSLRPCEAAVSRLLAAICSGGER